jgi:diguanylate cyclase (GGDEF)-like protein
MPHDSADTPDFCASAMMPAPVFNGPARDSGAVASSGPARADRRTRKRLSVTQAWYTTLLAVLIGVVFTLIQLAWDIRHFSYQIEAQVDHIYQMVNDSVVRAARDYDEQMAYDIANGIQVYPNIYRVEFTNMDDLVLARVVKQPRNGDLRRVADLLLGPNRAYTRPLFAFSDATQVRVRVGELKLYIDTEVAVIDFIDRIWVLFLTGLLRNLLLALLLSFVLYRKITAPILQLAGVVSTIDPAAPDPGVITPPRHHAHNEVGDLFKRLRDLLSQLAHSMALQRQSERQLRYLAETDPLTGVRNRRAFMDVGEKLIGQDEPRLCLMLFDVDHFKSINDSFGHDIGDVVLTSLAGLVQDRLRESDVLARVGGEEFAVLLPDCGIEEALKIADRLCNQVAEAVILPAGKRADAVTISIGLSTYESGDDSLATILKRADQAVYAAKRNGRNRVEVELAAVEVGASVAAPVDRGDDVRPADISAALNEGQFFLVYQPKVVKDDHGTVSWTGVEALLRWRHPRLGVLAPGRFLPLLENSSHRKEVYLWTLKEACRQCADWHGRCGVHLPVAVNIVADQLESESFPQTVAGVLEEFRLPPQAIELEITENSMMRNTAAAASALFKLNELGIPVALDDFGTGFSPLTHLLHFPVSRLKIDKEFVQRATSDERSAAIARAVLALGQELTLDVIAEGVETHDQMAWLSEHGCRRMWCRTTWPVIPPWPCRRSGVPAANLHDIRNIHRPAGRIRPEDGPPTAILDTVYVP